MIFKSNKKYAAKQISLGLELNETIFNAYTGTFLSGFLFECLPERFPKVIEIIFSMFEDESFKEKEFEKEKSVILSEFDICYSNPSDRLDMEIPRSVYGNSDYGLSDPIGTIEKLF